MTLPWNWLSGPTAAALTTALLHFLWQGTLLALLGWIAAQWLLRSPHARYAAWLTVLAAMTVSPLATLCWLGSSTETVAVEVADQVTANLLQGEVLSIAEPVPETSTTAFALPEWVPTSLPAEQLLPWQPYLLMGWLAGVLLTSLRVGLGAVWVMQVTRQLVELPVKWQRTAQRLARQLGLRSLPRLGLSDGVLEPLAVRIWRPTVILPTSWLTDMPAEVIEAVIAHELAHIRRFDLWVNLLQRVVESLLFFHPAVWWVSRQVRLERELCCDALAVSATGRVAEYARALEIVATWRLAGASPLLGTALGGTRMVLLQRVKRVLGLESAAADSGWWSWGVTAAGVAAVCWVGSALWTAPVQGEEDEPASAATASADGENDDDDDDKPQPPRRPQPPREGERRGEDRPRDGERRPDGPRDGDRRPEGGPRDGDRRPDGPPREGDRRPEGPPREGDRRPDGPPREGGPRGPRGEGEFRGPGPGFDRGPGGPGGPEMMIPEMMRALQQLREEVTRLRQEVNELRAQRQGPPFGREGGPREGGPRPGGPRPDGVDFVPPRERDGDRPRPPAEGRQGPRPEGREGPPRDRERGEGDRPRPPGEGRPRPEGERRPDRPEGDRRPEGEPRAENPVPSSDAAPVGN